ncbi:hypothetical protein CK516_32520 [Nostoc sp. 'Peltigera malacea cyanobiont' DB3992]|nr:hypothetical protein CK516_32520 [Nostoc sp. 'Peltigera malacea cyanobiont' DB3992]
MTFIRVKTNWFYLAVLVLQQKMSDPVLYCDRLNAEYADTWILKHLNIQVLKHIMRQACRPAYKELLSYIRRTFTRLFLKLELLSSL